MPPERLRIFISAVTGEFGRARDAIASDLRARGHEVAAQSDFTQGPDGDKLLGRLAHYIRDCNAVVCIVGKQCGACPPPRAAESFKDALPDGIKEASYTQWEFFLAGHFKSRPYLYIAGDGYKPDRDAAATDRAALQSAYREFLKAEGLHYTGFPNASELRIAVMRDEPRIAAIPELRQPAAKPIVLPYPSIGELFKGRDDFMRRLHESLTRARGARTAIISQALYGLGGIGKTRAAVEYAWAHADEYCALLFVVAETPEVLRRNLAALSPAMVPQLETTDDAVRLAAVLDWLKTNPGWFLILDNVDTRLALAEAEGLLSGLIGGHVIITSRLADFPGDIQSLELDVLPVEDAAKFLLARTEGKRRPAQNDEAKAREVAEELGRLALALEQAGAFIAKRRLTLAQYVEQWLSKREEVLAWFDPMVMRYPNAVAVTWQTSVAQLSEGGRRLLERLAWMGPEKVPESLLDVPVPGAEDENLRDACDDLAAYSLVTRDAEGPFFLVHRLVLDVTRRSLKADAQQYSLIDALRWIYSAFPSDSEDVRFWSQAEPLLPHALAVTAHADEASVSEPTSGLMSKVALLLYARALHAEAEPLMRRALAIDEKNYGLEHPSVAIDLNNLASLLQATNRLGEAEPLTRRALAIDEKSQGLDHPNVAVRLNNLAMLLQETKRLDEAEPLMRRALAIDKKNYGPDHPDVAVDLNNLAQLLKATNRLTEAEPLMRQSLAIDEKNYGTDHPRVAIDLNNLAQLLQATDRLEEAEPLLRHALAIDEKSYGPDHPRVAVSLNNLAFLLLDTNRLSEAEPLMRRAVTLAVKFTAQTGHRHPRLDSRLNAYKYLLARQRKAQSHIEAICTELLRPIS